MYITRTMVIGLLLLILVAFTLADHTKRVEPDHSALEVWRVSGAANACAPCGAICDQDDG